MQRSESIPRRLFKLALPVIGLNVLNVLALAVDTAMVGRTSNAPFALAGLGFATQLIFLLLVSMIGLSVGSVALVARSHGAAEPRQVGHILKQSAQFAIALGIAVGVGGNLFAPSLLDWMGASGESKTAALSYLRPILAGSPFYYLTILLGASLRGVGNTRLAFQISAAANLLNVAVNWVLILGHLGAPALGVFGAAIGTVSAQAFSALCLAYFVLRGAIPGITLTARLVRPDPVLLRQLLRIGTPAALDMLVLNAGFLSIIGLLGRLDPLAVAAHGIGLRIQALAFVPGMSISQATGAMVGNALGAKNLPEVHGIVRASLVMCTAIMVGLALGIWSLDGVIVTLFDVEPSSPLGQHTLTWMKILAVTMLPTGSYIALVGLFQGSGATSISLGINGFSTLMLQIPLSWFLGYQTDLGPAGVWLGFPAAFCLKAALAFVFWKRGSWIDASGAKQR